MIDETKLTWEVRSKIKEAKNSRQYGRLAEIYEQIGEFQEALDYYYDSKAFGQALQMAKTHMPEKVDEVYEKAAKILLNGTYYEIEQKIRPLFYDERAREIRDKLFKANIEEAEQERNFPTAARWCEELGDLERAAENFLKGGWRVDAAEIYERQGKFGEAAELYKQHGCDNKRIAKAYEKAEEKRKAAELYEEFSPEEAVRLYEEIGDTESRRRIWKNKYSDLSISALVMELTPKALEINRVDEIKNETARATIISELEQIEDHAPLRNYISTTRKREGNLINFLEEAYKDEESRAKLKRLATSGTNAYITKTVHHGSGEYGETEVTEHSHFDTEIEGIDSTTISLSIAYLLTKGGWEEFSTEERYSAQQNMRNIWTLSHREKNER